MTETILPGLTADLDDYIDRLASEWLRQPEDARAPTLPSTTGGKVNARAVILALKRPPSQVQHLFKKPGLRAAINAVAIEQGLKPISENADAAEDAADVDKAVQNRMRRAEKRANDVGRLVAEQAAVIEKQRRTIVALREQIRIFEETGQVLRTAPVRT